MNQFINGVSNQDHSFDQQHQSTSHKISQGRISLSEEEIVRFNMELRAAFKDIVDTLESNQIQAMNGLSQKQTEMFQLSNKYRMPSGFKNDAIGVWYDAKSTVTQQISKIKQFIQEKGVSIMAQTFQANNSSVTDITGGPNMTKQDYSQLIQRFEEDMVNLKKGAKDYNNQVTKLRQALMDHDDALKKEHQILFKNQKDLFSSVTNYNDILVGRESLQDQVQSLENQSQQQRVQALGNKQMSNSNSLIMSPFEKKLNTYQKTALNRSNSRGSQATTPQHVVGQKPPKLQQQSSSTSWQSKRPSVTGQQSQHSPFRGGEKAQENDWHADLRLIKSRLVDFDNSVNSYISELNEKQIKMDEILRNIDEHVHTQLMKFLQTHDTELVKQFFTNTILTPTETAHIVAKANLHAHQFGAINSQKSNTATTSNNSAIRRSQSSISPIRQGAQTQSQRENSDLMFRKTTPTRKQQKNSSSTRFGGSSLHGHTPSRDLGTGSKMQGGVGESQRLQELQQNTDQLFGELRKANEKCMEQQVESRRLKDQVQVLQLQIEDLRIHNNRYQMQAQSYQNQISSLKQKKQTRTARAVQSNFSAQEIQSPSQQFGIDGSKVGQPSVGSASYSLDLDEMLAEERELCKRIDLFFTAMKLLQRAVNRKEDISQLKVEFETKQRALQKLSKQIQARINGSKIQKPQDNIFVPKQSESIRKSSASSNLRNRSQSTRTAQIHSHQMARQQHTSSSHRIPGSPLRSKNSAPRKFNKSNNSQISPKPVKIQESEKLNSQLNKNSFQTHKMSLNKSIEQEVDSNKQQYVQMQSNMALLQQQKDELQQILFNHQKELAKQRIELNAKANTIDQQNLYAMNQMLKQLEIQLQNSLNNELPQAGEENLNVLKEKLVKRIVIFEQALVTKYTNLQQRLEQRESELDAVKKLFVEKLRELETNFAEIGDHIMANQANHERQQLELQNSKQSNPEHQSTQLLKQYLTDEAQQSREQEDKALEDLLNTNQQLNDQIDQLKQQCKDYIQPDIHNRILEQVKEYENKFQLLDQENRELVKKTDTTSKEKELQNQELIKVKLEKQKTQGDLSKTKQQLQANKLEFEEKEMILQGQMKEIEGKLKSEIELRLCAQKEAKDTDNMAQLLEEDFENIHKELEDEKKLRSKMKKEFEENKQKAERELDTKELELIQRNAELAEAKEKYQEMSIEIEQKKEELQQQKDILDQNQQKYGQIQQKLDDEIKQEQYKLKEEMRSLKQNNSNLQGKLKQEADEQAKLKRQQWWMTALQLRVKKIVQKQIEKEQDEAQKLRQDLTQKQLEQEELQDEQNRQKVLIEQQTKQKSSLEDKLKQLKLDQEEKDNQIKELTLQNENRIEELKANQDGLNKKIKRENQELLDQLTEQHSKQVSEVDNQLQIKEVQIKELKAAVQEAKQSAFESAKQKDDLAAMTAHQEQSKTILDSLRSKLADQVADKQQEIEKLIQEKQEAETQRDEAVANVQELKTDIDKIEKSNELQQQKLSDEIILFKETSKIQDQKTQSLMKSVQDFEQKEKQLKEQLESKTQKEVGTTSKVNDLDHQLKKQIQETESISQKMQAQLNALESQREQLIQSKENSLNELQVTSEELSGFKKRVTDHEEQIKQLTTTNKEMEQQIGDLNQQLDVYNKKSINLESQISKFDTNESSLKKQIESLKDQIGNLETEKSGLASSNKDLNADIKLQQSEIKLQIQKFEEQQKEYESIKSQQFELNQSNEKQKETIESTETELKNAEFIILELKSQIERQDKEIKELEEQQKKAMAEVELNVVESQQVQEQKLNNQIEEQKTKIDDLNKKIQDFEKKTEENNTKFDDQVNLIGELKTKVEQNQKLEVNQDKKLIELQKLEEEQDKKLIELQKQLEESSKLKEEADKLKKEVEASCAQSINDLKQAHENELKKSQELLDNNDKLIQSLKSEYSTEKESFIKQIEELQKKQDDDKKSKENDNDNENSKKIEELSNKLKKSDEELEEMKEELVNQKQAYEVLLDTLKDKETSELSIKEQKSDVDTQVKTLEDLNKQLSQQVLELEDKVETLEKDQGRESKGALSKNSINSDGDEYKNVEEMRDHLKHARQLLIAFIKKLPYTAPENEATLPVIFSMFEFTKEEQEKLQDARMTFNQERVNQEIKKGNQKLFGKMFGKKGQKTKTEGSQSFASGGGNSTGASHR